MIVVDTNVLAARSLTSARTNLAGEVERIDPMWIVPPLWRCEFQNILAKAIWARQIMPGEAVGLWRTVAARLSDNEHEPSPEKVIEIAARHRITAYDANFVALAMELGVLCVTEDRELREKFPVIAVSMEDFAKRDAGEMGVRETETIYRTRRGRKA